jgi:hypothetical protein
MKQLKLAIILVLLCFLVSSYAMQPKDLNGAEVIAQGTCSHLGHKHYCLFLKQGKNLYVVAIESEKPVAIYSVKKLKDSYQTKEMTLLWSDTLT